MSFSTVTVVGLGYIGLPTAAVLASRKIRVVGVDVNQVAVDTINRGGIHIVEPDLDIAVKSVVLGGYLRATTKPVPSEAFLIAVPTPFKGDHDPDLSYIEAASASIAPVLKKGDLVVLESTSPVGTTEKMSAWLEALRPDLTFPQTHGSSSDIRIAYCPERVLPGHVLRELVQNDRVIGGMTKECAARACELYRTFVEGDCVVTDARTAELCKLAENSFRDVNIAFANELSIISKKQGIDVWELIRLANRHPRVNILQPGPGVGGHCIAVDPWFIVSSSPNEARLISTARLVNDSKPKYVLNEIVDALRTSSLSKVVCYGLSFKPNVDDMRESPALRIYSDLRAKSKQVEVYAVEPHLLVGTQPESISLIRLEDALAMEAVHVMLVDHSAFRQVRPQRGPVLDTRGIWTESRLR